MDGLGEKLFRVEGAEYEARVSIGAPAYDTSVREQLRPVAASKGAPAKVANVERLLALSQLDMLVEARWCHALSARSAVTANISRISILDYLNEFPGRGV